MLKENEAILKIRSDVVKKEEATMKRFQSVVLEPNVIGVN